MSKKSPVSEELSTEIQKQVDNNVVLYNIKDKNAFFIISPEEARFVMDAVREKRIEGKHYCNLTELKDQKHWKNKDEHEGIYMFIQHLSNIQLSIGEEYYSVANPGLRGAVCESNTKAGIFDIATHPTGFLEEETEEKIKECFLSILKEKLHNDINTYNELIKALGQQTIQVETETTKGCRLKYNKAKLNIEDWEVAAKIIERSVTACPSSLTEEQKQARWEKNRQEELLINNEIKRSIKALEDFDYDSDYLERRIKAIHKNYPKILSLNIQYLNNNLPFGITKDFRETAITLGGWTRNPDGSHSGIRSVVDRITEGEEVGLFEYKLNQEEINGVLDALEKHLKENDKALKLHVLINNTSETFGIVGIEM